MKELLIELPPRTTKYRTTVLGRCRHNANIELAVRLMGNLEKINLMYLTASPNYGSAGKSSDCCRFSHSAFLLTYISNFKYERQKSC
jgi:hypothetical protein